MVRARGLSVVRTRGPARANTGLVQLSNANTIPIMDASSPPMCLLCRTAVKAKDRKVIRSTKNAIPILTQYMSEIRPSSIAAILHDRAILCRPCLRSVDKLHNLREEASKVDAGIRLKMEHIIGPYRLQDQVEEQPTAMQFGTPEKCTSKVDEPLITPSGVGYTPKTKRACTSGKARLFTPTTASKRARYDSPTRTTLQKMVPVGSSPAVAVSTIERVKLA